MQAQDATEAPEFSASVFFRLSGMLSNHFYEEKSCTQPHCIVFTMLHDGMC